MRLPREEGKVRLSAMAKLFFRKNNQYFDILELEYSDSKYENMVITIISETGVRCFTPNTEEEKALAANLISQSLSRENNLPTFTEWHQIEMKQMAPDELVNLLDVQGRSAYIEFQKDIVTNNHSDA